MNYKKILFDHYLSYKHLSLSSPYPQGYSLNYLETIGDFECTKILREKNTFSNPEGNSVVRAQICKNFSYDSDVNIILKANIADFITLISLHIKISKIEIPDSLQNINDIYTYINNSKSLDHTQYVVDFWGLDFSKIIRSDIAIFSSIEILYGIEGINIAWLISRDNDVINCARSISHNNGSSCNSLGEIYALIALRNHDILITQNAKISSENKRYIINFIEKFTSINIQISELYCIATLTTERCDELINFMKQRYGILLFKSLYHPNAIIIHYGKRKFMNDFQYFTQAIADFFNS